jgi:two-component system nitrate/nitrite response regulator NarL
MFMRSPIKVAILEDHQSIIDGYQLRLDDASGIKVVGTASNGEELNSMLVQHPAIDVLIMDITVPSSPINENPIPILQYVPQILEGKPNLNILIISMHTQASLVKALADVGVSGYIFKHDSDSIRRLPAIIRSISSGQKYFTDNSHGEIHTENAAKQILTGRQLQVLAFCAANPDLSTDQVATELGIASSTIRNLLSESYERLNVHTKAAAIAKARMLGLIP